MTQDQKAAEHKALKLEIRGRKELLKRLEHPTALLKTAGQKQKAKRAERTAKGREFSTYEEAQEAYGYDLITEDEFREIAEALEHGEDYIENTTSPEELAMDMLTAFTSRIANDIRSFEFELLPEDEQARRMEATERRREEIAARKERRS